jgi:pimeloyl-ACP methyl ester carboxylesterase
VRREHRELWAHGVGAAGTVLAYGHAGRPVLVFPSELGSAADFEQQGMVDAVADLVEAGRITLYCVDAFDGGMAGALPADELARRDQAYEHWILDEVVPWIFHDAGGPREIITVGCRLGALHALTFAVKRADLFPLALCFGPDAPARADDPRPSLTLPPMSEEHLAWLRSRLSVLVVLDGADQPSTSSATSSATSPGAGLGHALRDSGVRVEVDVFAAPDWAAWQRRLAHHLPRFC